MEPRNGGDATARWLAAPSGQRRVLVVEDSRLVQRTLREFFQGVGYQVSVAGNGREALGALKAHPPAIIISDIVMPVMDGWELCEAARADPAIAGIPFLFVTSAREVAERVRALQAGADDAIVKPFTNDELLARVERILARVDRLRAADVGGGAALSGHSSQLAITDLFQLLSLNGKDGVVALRDDAGRTGRVELRGGRIVHAVAGDLEGRKALFRLLDWGESRFELDPLAEPGGDTISGDTTAVLMEALTHNDEMRRLLEGLPALVSPYRPSESARGPVVQAGLEERERAILVQFVPAASLAEVLDWVALPDLEIGQILRKLLGLGLLVPAPDASQ